VGGRLTTPHRNKLARYEMSQIQLAKDGVQWRAVVNAVMIQ